MSFLTDKFPQLEAISPSVLMEKIQALQPRERNLVFAASGAILGFMIYLGISSGLTKTKLMRNQIASAQSAIVRVQELTQELEQQNRQVQELRGKIRPGANFYLSTFMEAQLARHGLPADQVGNESRQDLGDQIEEVSIDVKLSKISFPKLLQLTNDLESSSEGLIRLKRVRIRAIPGDEKFLELNMKVSAFVQKS